MAKIIGDTACPKCVEGGGDRTGNHLMLFDDGGAYCNRCGYGESVDTFTPVGASFSPEKSDEELAAEMEEVGSYPIRSIPERNVSELVAKRYGVLSSLSTTNRDKATAHYFPNITESGTLQGYKIRYLSGKYFGKAGKTKGGAFFGINQCPKSGNKLFITEGEYDAMALYEAFLQNTKPEWVKGIAIVSLTYGAGAEKTEVLRNREFLEGFKTIVCVFDQDDAGRKAAENFKQAMPDKSVVYARFKEKDACEAVAAGNARELFFSCITGKTVVRPEKIIYGDDIPLAEFMKPLKKGLSIPYPGIMEKMHGFRYGDGGGELTIVTAGTGMGKTTLAREIMYHFNKVHQLKLGNIFLEEQRRKTGQSYIAIDNNIPLGVVLLTPGDNSGRGKGPCFDRVCGWG